MQKALFLFLFSLFFGGALMAFTITSEAFTEGGTIPKKYTGEGVDISPKLQWKEQPQGTKSFALIMDDPDAPRGTWVHWVLYNIPASTSMLPEGIEKQEELSSGAKQGITDFGSVGYGGPYPPPGLAHRYFFKLYALDSLLDLPARATKAAVEDAMKGHILAETKLMGKYERK